MATYKNITIPKRGGGTRKQRVQVLRSGKYKFVKNKASSRKRKKNNPKRSIKKVARRRSRSRSITRRRNGGIKIPIALVGGVAAMPAVQAAINNAMVGQYQNVIPALGGIVRDPIGNLKPLVIGWGIHWLAGKLGINRMLGQARIPLIRI